MHEFIPYGRHQIDEEDIQYVTDVLKSSWLTCGPIVEQLEHALAKALRSEHAIACSNGTTALHLALLALGIKDDDWVIVPAITFLATANAVRYLNANVLFADVDPYTGLVSPETLEQAIERFPQKHKIKAFINVHFAGQCGDLESLFNIAKKNNLFIIEDAAHAIGTEYVDSKGHSHSIGSCDFADMTTFSFHPVKTIATGEGGAITTNSPDYHEKLTLFRSHGMIKNPEQWIIPEQAFDKKTSQPNPWYYEMQALGFNYRISDINCALGLSQLKKLDQFKSKITEIKNQYDTAFLDLSYASPLSKLNTSNTCWHLYILLINFEMLGTSRADLMNKLKASGIGTQVHYIPVHRQPYYQALYQNITLPGADDFYAHCLTLPLFSSMSTTQVSKVVRAIRNI